MNPVNTFVSILKRESSMQNLALNGVIRYFPFEFCTLYTDIITILV